MAGETGSRPPLLLIHGITATAHAWDSVRPLLDADYELVVPTLVGHCGGPAIPDRPSRPMDLLVEGLERVLDEAGHRTAHLLGNSLGGYLAFELAARGRARSLVAISPGQGWEGETVPRGVVRFFRRSNRLAPHAARVADVIAARPRARYLALRDVVAHPERVPRAAAVEMIRSAAECPMLELFGNAALAGDFRSELAAPGVPVLIGWGDRDRILPEGVCSPYFRRLVPDAEWVSLRECGHVAQLDEPELIARLVRRTTARADGGGAGQTVADRPGLTASCPTGSRARA